MTLQVKAEDDAVYCSPRLYGAFVGLGLGSWVMSDFVFAEIAALVQYTPEAASIGAYVIVALQSANIFPMLYMLLNNRQQCCSIPTMIWMLLCLGLLTCFLLSAFWHSTSEIFGYQHSTALLFLIFCGGVVSATSSVVFYPFVSAFPTSTTSALATGESFSAVIAGLLALAQNVGSTEMTFSISVYFLCASIVLIVSLTSFGYLRYKSPKHTDENLWLLDPTQKFSCQADLQIFRTVWKPLLCQCILACFSFAVIPSVLPILVMKYKNGGVVLKWASILGMLCDPSARFLTSFYRIQQVEALTLLALIAALWIAIQASFDDPLLSQEENGGTIVIVIYCLYMFLSGYTQTSLFQVLKNLEAENVKTAYQWSGFVTQMGALFGTVVTFTLVTATKVFT